MKYILNYFCALFIGSTSMTFASLCPVGDLEEVEGRMVAIDRVNAESLKKHRIQHFKGIKKIVTRLKSSQKQLSLIKPFPDAKDEKILWHEEWGQMGKGIVVEEAAAFRELSPETVRDTYHPELLKICAEKMVTFRATLQELIAAAEAREINTDGLQD